MKAFYFIHRLILVVGVFLSISFSLQAAQQCLVLGDSLTKEYEVEFPVLYPERTDAWKARNWIEILHEWRRSWFDQGSFSAYYDVRIVGHKHNWAFPGATTQELRDALSSTAWQNKLWQAELKSQLKNTVERVVIFAGGNDVDSYYGKIYNGSSPTTYVKRTRDNLIWIVDYVRAQKSSLPIVLVSVPHVGCAPDVQHSYPTDTVKTGRVTAALDSLNAQLASISKTRGAAFADGVYPFTKGLVNNRFFIGSQEINRGANMDALPSYAFSGDGFHPTSAMQVKIAQIIVDTFRARWASSVIPAISDAEITNKILPALTP
jgi:lysophospholipase L1-like esterase